MATVSARKVLADARWVRIDVCNPHPTGADGVLSVQSAPDPARNQRPDRLLHDGGWCADQELRQDAGLHR